MNKRRLSYGLLVTLAAAMMAACGGEDQPAVPAQPTAAPADTGAPTAAAEARQHQVGRELRRGFQR